MYLASSHLWGTNFEANEKDAVRLRIAQRAMERKVMGVTLQERKRAEWLKEQMRVNVHTASNQQKKKLPWAGDRVPFPFTVSLLDLSQHVINSPLLPGPL